LSDTSRTADDIRKIRALRNGIAAVEDERAVVRDGAGRGEISCRAAPTDLERAGADGRCADVGVRASEDKVAATRLNESSRAGDVAGKVGALGDSVGPIEGESAVVNDSTADGKGARRATCADLERAIIYRGAAIVGIRTGKRGPRKFFSVKVADDFF
jgi:hypothetical protein